MENQTVEVQNALQQAGAVAGLGLSEKTQIMLWIGIIVYVAVLIGIGMWSSRKVKGMNDFLVAGRRLPLWMATATLLATWFGAGSSMGVAATVYSDGIGGVLADPFGASASLIISGIFIVGLLRRLAEGGRQRAPQDGRRALRPADAHPEARRHHLPAQMIQRGTDPF